SFFGKEPNRSVNPDEVVAAGAAVQAGAPSGEVKDLLRPDGTPLSRGIETLSGGFTRLSPRNTTIPTRRSEIFSTAADTPTSVEIHVLQGEREMAADNRTLGRFRLEGIPPAPRGVPQIEVTFDIDANGIVNVSARDKATGKEQKITITGASGMTKEEIERAVSEAKAHEAEDRKRREEAEVRNNADNLLYQTEKLLSENRDKLPKDVVDTVEARLSDLKGALERKASVEEVRRAMDELTRASHKIAEKLYEAAGTAAQGGSAQADGGAAKEAKKEEDVVDAEFEEKR